ncbi:WSC-domain-containing protein [Clavulina sp. PMI_390]|nr:WSC-domain-containing protein [Clavulina sp. PMI_390]
MMPSFTLPFLLFLSLFHYNLTIALAADDKALSFHRLERAWRSALSRHAPNLVPGRSLYIRGTVPSGWTQTGCYTDAQSPRALASYSSSSSSNTVTSCLNACQNLGYTMGGVEYGSQCYCANSLTTSTNPSVGQSAPSTDCSMVCSGDSTQTCGNGNRIMVYTYSGTSNSAWSYVQ